MRINEQKSSTQPFNQQSQTLDFEEEPTGEAESHYSKVLNTKTIKQCM